MTRPKKKKCPPATQPAFITRTQFAADAGERARRRAEIRAYAVGHLGSNRQAARLAARLERAEGCQ